MYVFRYALVRQYVFMSCRTAKAMNIISMVNGADRYAFEFETRIKHYY